ncbi:MAG: DNA alkylation repair protein [Candidatus Levybacteria bacterium]|nr:DNA alkylation repair protein [Candidatus Levybacteria bacterium]
MQSVIKLRKDLHHVANPKKVALLQKFFKTKEGEYGHGDIFIGVTVPNLRLIAKKYSELNFSNVETLLMSPIHEERLLGLLILVLQFEKGSNEIRKRIYNFYLSHTAYINNWDLVDLSADKIVGGYLLERSTGILTKLATSDSLWDRRIAVIATYQFIKEKKEYKETFRIARILLHDDHDLIHKAVGWMLREVGKRCSREILSSFLVKHYKAMPRTCLRYAIEHYSSDVRKKYLLGVV